MPDAVEAGWQHVQQEAADELLGGEAHRLEPVWLAVILPAEADGAVHDVQDAVVGDRDAVGVAAEVVEHTGGAVEGRLGVDDPFGPAQGPQVAVEGGRLGERGKGAVEAQAAVAEGAFELVQEEGAETAREDADRQEEAGPAGDPAVALGGEAAARDDAVEVGVVAEVAARMRCSAFRCVPSMFDSLSVKVPWLFQARNDSSDSDEYIPNGAFIIALAMAGCTLKRVNFDSLNAKSSAWRSHEATIRMAFSHELVGAREKLADPSTVQRNVLQAFAQAATGTEIAARPGFWEWVCERRAQDTHVATSCGTLAQFARIATARKDGTNPASCG